MTSWEPDLFTVSALLYVQLLIADKPTAETAAMRHMNLRDRMGNIRRVLDQAPTPPTHFVPSLGDFVDVFVDVFGYEDALIVSLYNARVRARNCDDWLHSVTHMLSIMEARWFWRFISIPSPRFFRVRDYDFDLDDL